MSAAEGSTEPKQSSLPDSLASLLVKPDASLKPSAETVDSLERFQRAANYLSVSQIFLKWAPLKMDDLKIEDVKKRLLGHFGTGPGLVFVYAHTSLLIKETGHSMVFVTGPGHGAPAILSSLYLEGSMTRFYGKYGLNKPGLDAFTKAFSWPGGFPSHVNAETPGALHEGGELGYALAVAYGSVFDHPDLITVAVIGDGESETGPTATAWHAHKYLDPKESGAVLPVLHANGFKISERTIFGTMDDKEVVALFSGYGYQVCIVEYENMAVASEASNKKVQEDMYAAMRWAYGEIRRIQKAAREGKPITKPRWPMIFMRTPKGWGGPKKVDGLPVLNSFRAHQVPLPAAGKDKEQFGMLKDWLASYSPQELFDETPGAAQFIRKETVEILPSDPNLLLGQTRYAWPEYQPLDLPADWQVFTEAAGEETSPMKAIGLYLNEAFKANPKRLRMFSPDELRSNKLDSILDFTNRDFQWDPETAHRGGRVVEMLSEHTLQGFLQGYTLTGRTGIFPSYEAFLAIVDTMILQFAKFVKVAQETNWRPPVPSLNYIETSTLWRQEHNGYSHQAPGLINTLLTLPAHLVRVYLPPDGNCAVSCMDHMLKSKGYINLLVGSKNPGSNWLSPEEANDHCVAGVSIWKRFSTDEGKDPDVVLVGAGVEVTTEVINAAALLKKQMPNLRVRVVNVVDLLVLAEPGSHPHALDEAAFNSIFTKDKPIIINFHGYPSAVASLLFARTTHVSRGRITIKGYMEEGTTTTPYSMLRLNGVGRFDVAAAAIRAAAANSTKFDVDAHQKITYFQHQNVIAEKFSLETGDDDSWFQGGKQLFEQ